MIRVINKQSMWFLTLFSLILVLSVYYITMPNELLLTNNGKTEKQNAEVEDNKKQEDAKVTIQESETLVTMRVTLEEEREKQMSELKTTLTSEKATASEKNDAYEQMKIMNEQKANESSIDERG